ncbi:MAG: hypothetical protein [Bacteriophage sp.]|nr:MAG: hypothetical protein [Bacteriophage sp.]
MIIDPKATKVDPTYARNFAMQTGLIPYYDYNTTGTKKVLDLLPQAIKKYGEMILAGNLSKGTRPWELVDVTSGLDPDSVWVGLEWETGFVSRQEYQGVIQYMWQTHHNWAVDDEGIGPYRGEFTFPPIELNKFTAGESMMDDMRKFMAEKNIITPTCYTQIVNPSTKKKYTGRQDARDGWGMHVNISVPGARDNELKWNFLGETVRHIFQYLLDGEDDDILIPLFGRDPYGWMYSRQSGGLNWHEFKLFRTPASDEEVDRIRMVTTRLAEMMHDIVDNPSDYYTLPVRGSNHATIGRPTAENMRDYLLGDVELLELTSSVQVYHNPDFNRLFK